MSKEKVNKILVIFFVTILSLLFGINKIFAKDNPLYKFEKTGGVPAFTVSNDLLYRKETSTGGYEEINLTISNNGPNLNMGYWYLGDYEPNVRNPNGWIGYVYVDTNKLTKSENITLINFPIKNGLDCPGKNNCGMNAIIYHKERKEIISILGDINNDGRGVTRANVLYDNIDENTPNFLFLLDVRRYLFKDSSNKWQFSTSMYIYKEDIPGSGKLSDKRLFFAGSTPVISDYNNYEVSFFPGITPIQYRVSGNGNSGIFNPSVLCGTILKYSLSNPDKLKQCLNEAQQFIVNTYGRAWEKDFGLQTIEKPSTTVTDPNNIFDSTEELENCETAQIGCYISNLGKTIKNSIGGFLNSFNSSISSISTSFFNGIENIFNSIFNKILDIEPVKFVKNILTGVYNFFEPLFKTIYKVATFQYDFNTLFWGDQNFVCSNLPRGFFQEYINFGARKPLEALGFLWFFINPFPPEDGSHICTSLGIRQINYGRDTILDGTIFLFFFISGLWFPFIFLNKSK